MWVKPSSILIISIIPALFLTSTLVTSFPPPTPMQTIIYGTAWKKEQTTTLVYNAIQSGFRRIDTACQPKHYSEQLVGLGLSKAMTAMNLSRDELWIQTKYTSIGGQDPSDVPYNKNDPIEEQVKTSLTKSLQNLQTTYIDSLLLHSPLSAMEDTLRVWKVFESAVDEGTVKSIGISNIYDYKQLKQLYETARIKPTHVQNRFYSTSGFDVGIRRFCDDKGITYQSFWTLTASRANLKNTDIVKFARDHNMSPEGVMYSFCISLGIHPLSGTSDSAHMKEDAELGTSCTKVDNVFTRSEEGKRFKARMAEIVGVTLDVGGEEEVREL